jgi:hypothetical protein
MMVRTSTQFPKGVKAMRTPLVRVLATALAAVALLGPAPDCQAVVLPSGTFIGLFGTSAAARPELVGVALQDNLIPFTITDASNTVLFQGTVQDRVVRSEMTGALHFYFFIRDTDSTGRHHIVGVSRTGFGNGSTDVDYRTDGLGDVGPWWASRLVVPDEVDFDFSLCPIYPGLESLFTFVVTEATDFAQTGTLTLYTEDGSSVTLTCAAPK